MAICLCGSYGNHISVCRFVLHLWRREPTFVLDLAIVTPSAIWCGIALLRKNPAAYQLTPVLLTALTGVGIVVIYQTIVQSSLGITLNPGQLFVLVISFIILGCIAFTLNLKLFKGIRGHNGYEKSDSIALD